VIDSALHDRLKGECAPLVLAAVEYLFPLYRAANTYPHLVEDGVAGNPEGTSLDELRARAWNLVQPYFEKAELDALARYQQLAGTGLTSCDLEEVVRAAFEGRVRALFVAPHVQKWGTFDTTTETVHIQPLAKHDGEELLNLAAIYTLSNRGEVYFIEPKVRHAQEPAAAIYRY
jgi:hypothetical protein